MGSIVLAILIVIAFFLVFFRLIRIVREQQAFIVEQFGKFNRALGAGLHLVVPIIQKVAYKQSLKEQVIDVPPQVCITRDNVQVAVDGVLYFKIVDPVKASYGIENYRFATGQIAQTTMRSEIGKIDLDRTFSEREALNDAIVQSVDEASDPWGIKVTRYEIKDISPSSNVFEAMEQQMRAEREKRADILRSEGEKEARINVSKGEREHAINLSKGEKQRRINDAAGKAKGIELTAEATAEGIREIAKTIHQPKGKSAVSLRIAEQFINQFGNILDTAETSVLPMEVAQIKSIFEAVLSKDRRVGSETSEKIDPVKTAEQSTRAKPDFQRIYREVLQPMAHDAYSEQKTVNEAAQWAREQLERQLGKFEESL